MPRGLGKVDPTNIDVPFELPNPYRRAFRASLTCMSMSLSTPFFGATLSQGFGFWLKKGKGLMINRERVTDTRHRAQRKAHAERAACLFITVAECVCVRVRGFWRVEADSPSRISAAGTSWTAYGLRVALPYTGCTRPTLLYTLRHDGAAVRHPATPPPLAIRAAAARAGQQNLAPPPRPPPPRPPLQSGAHIRAAG